MPPPQPHSDAPTVSTCMRALALSEALSILSVLSETNSEWLPERPMMTTAATVASPFHTDKPHAPTAADAAARGAGVNSSPRSRLFNC